MMHNQFVFHLFVIVIHITPHVTEEKLAMWTYAYVMDLCICYMVQLTVAIATGSMNQNTLYSIRRKLNNLQFKPIIIQNGQ